MGITSILMIMAAVLFIVIVALSFAYMRMNAKEEKGERPIAKGTTTATQTKKTTGTASGGAQGYNKQSIFSFMEFDRIEDNMIVQKNGNRYLMAIECQGINYDLMSRVEKTAVEEGFNQFLNTLRHPIQIYTQTRTINLDSSLQNYRGKVDSVKDEIEKKENHYKQMVESGGYTEEELQKYELEIKRARNMYEYGKDIIFNTEKMSLNKNVLRKQYYIIIPYYANEAGNELFDKDEIKNLAFSELYTKAQSIIRTLSACSIAGRILDSYDLVDLLYNAYNRDESEVYGMRKAMQAGYDEIYSTAQDVLDKKIRALNEEIKEKGLEKARNVVDQVQSEKEKELEKMEKTFDDLIDDMAIRILQENEKYIGKDVSERAQEKVKQSARGRKTKEVGGNSDEQKKTIRARRASI